MNDSYRGTVVISSVGLGDETSKALARRAIERYARAHSEVIEDWLAHHPEALGLYEYGEQGRIRYLDADGGIRCWREENGQQVCWRMESEWADIPEMLEKGGSTCFSLACWCAAMRRLEGIPATPRVWRVEETPTEHRFHVVCEKQLRDGRGNVVIESEDPSHALGMFVPIHGRKQGYAAGFAGRVGQLSPGEAPGYHFCEARGWHPLIEHSRGLPGRF